jgi:hypothetical protein
MRSAILTSICFLLLVNIAYSALVEVGIAEVLEGNISSINYDVTSNLVKFSFEFYNTGSIAYNSRIKLEVYNDTDLLFIGWGPELEFMSGEKKVSDIYWYANNIGDYSAKLKVYFGNEIKEYKKFDVPVSEYIEPEDVFEIRNMRTYDDHIIFDVYSVEDAENVVVIPKQYTPGWIFEEAEIDSIASNSSGMVVLNYYPTVWKPSNVTIQVVSDQGAYYTEERAEMVKEEGLLGLVYSLIDNLRIALFK